MSRTAERDRGRLTRWTKTLSIVRELYFGASPLARRFRYGVLVFDVATVIYVVATTVTGTAYLFPGVDFAIGVVLLVDLTARTLAMRRSARQLRSVNFYLDVVVIAALFGSALVPNLDFARVLRLLRVLHSYRLTVELRRDFPWFRRNEEVVESGVHLAVFLFITTALVYLVEAPRSPEVMATFLDAFYFTIATLTTTGFGDIVLTGPWGRAMAVVIMVIGVSLFLRLIQTLFRPSKVAFECPECGLNRHDRDAVHCKHCGATINIPFEGAI